MLGFMEADRAQLSKIDAQILELQDSLSALRAEKQLVEERLNSYKYPVLTLPNEMVSDILVHCLPPYPSCPPLIGVSSPTSLTHICRKWRTIALATPELWRAIRVDDVSSFHRSASEVWAKRSRSLPLSVNIEIHRSHEINLPLLAHRAHWEHLTLSVVTPIILTIDDPMPLLRHLELTQYNMASSFELRDAPQLCSVVFQRVGAVTLPWQQLTHLTMNDELMDKCLLILRQTTNLIYCDVTVTVWGARPDVLNHQSITLPFLEALIFRMSPENLGTSFLDLFTVPTLRSLELREPCIWPDPIGYLTSFIARSHCRLQTLEITGRRRIHDDAYRFAFSSIPELIFDLSYFDPS
ncbi:F-box domain-containing protein [Mycena sanguinolenta]|uniref:F-box domain-containing protein n=1 Tax=Mycena sanguinolenta TaxID=230812 RepID=A0A8H7DK76_9AGAR|nr:F-box domain-containing protein [Mycena sanguinolenta]